MNEKLNTFLSNLKMQKFWMVFTFIFVAVFFCFQIYAKRMFNSVSTDSWSPNGKKSYGNTQHK